jgi:hypothetical protein
LNFYAWDTDGGRDGLRDAVVEVLGDAERGVLIVDETGFLKKSVMSAGVGRQHSGTAVGSRTLRSACFGLRLRSWAGVDRSGVVFAEGLDRRSRTVPGDSPVLSATWASRALPACDTTPSPADVTSTFIRRPSRVIFT